MIFYEHDLNPFKDNDKVLKIKLRVPNPSNPCQYTNIEPCSAANPHISIIFKQSDISPLTIEVLTSLYWGVDKVEFISDNLIKSITSRTFVSM